MRSKSPIQIRRELAEGHWLLGEHRQAISCLRLALEAEPEDSALHELLERFLSAGEQGVVSEGNREALAQLVHPPARVRPSAMKLEPGSVLATPTLAELLEQQGHRKRALEVTEGVLRKSPHDERALAVRNRLCPPARPVSRAKAYKRQINVLEGWCDYFRSRNQGDALA